MFYEGTHLLGPATIEKGTFQQTDILQGHFRTASDHTRLCQSHEGTGALVIVIDRLHGLKGGTLELMTSRPTYEFAGKIYRGGILHIYLDELDNRSKEQQALIPNGFTEPTIINDFPIRDRKVVLHIRRHRWLDADGHNIVLNVYNLATKGTRYSEEFAAFLKERLGYLPSDSTFAGAVLQD